jgi:ATP-binding cassette, subfamily C (CFTR/MRP), member 4
MSDSLVAKMDNFSAYWNQEKAVLKDISVKFKRGECVCIVGKVGSGKTSLLNCFLKEVPYYSGYIESAGKIAYVE